MPCFSPLNAFRGAQGVFFNEKEATGVYYKMKLACQKCIGCRVEYSRQWAVRIMCEAKLYKANCFVTLTYSEDRLLSPSLRYDDFQRFMKRLRKRYPGTRMFMCGEYGELDQRPHFHACLFGIDFQDKYPWSKTSNGDQLYRSSELESIWQEGFCSVGELNFKTAAYVARYIVKKVTGDLAEHWYEGREPEFCQPSLKPGVGARWIDRWETDVYPRGLMVVNGKEVMPPKYFDRRWKRREIQRHSFLERVDSSRFKVLSRERVLAANASAADRTPDRLDVRRQVAAARLAQLKRNKL